LKNSKSKKNIIILLGQTGVGKTKLSLGLAGQTGNTEIISADSMQIYKYMNIGTDKPNQVILNTIKHHMIDIIEPDQPFDVLQYCEKANKTILDISKRKKIPIIVGGTGLYISSMISPLFLGPGKDPEVRRVLNEKAEKHGIHYLYTQLSGIDPECAQKIHPNDLYRIIRALEVFEITGKTMSSQRESHAVENLHFNFHIFGLYRNREVVYEKINARVDEMIKQGLIDEVKLLRQMGYKDDLNAMQGSGYKQVNKYLNAEYGKETAIDRIKIDTRHYAKRQMTWFKHKIKNIEWIDLDQYEEDKILTRMSQKMEEIYRINHNV